MKLVQSKAILLVTGIVVIATTVYFFTSREAKVDFSADVKPILNSKCISCHGGVTAKGGFSVLFPEEALGNTASGKPAIIPGKPGASEMIKRLTSSDPEERMPYKHAPLSKDEIGILKRWVKQGAKWRDHWAYVAVEETEVPVIESEWATTTIDKFVAQKLEEKKLTPSPQADKATLLRRVSLDLIGTYPGEKIADQYLTDTTASAYERLVDSLLASERYGEKWASMWLDLARYADTKGYESDNGREIWKYRDWVIKAFNKDMPYDQFVTEQLAGDLFPDPTDEQFIATGFSRNSMTNDEGGTDNEEFRNAAVMDRVNTTWEALMSTTFSCVQCHSHPYDPFRHDEYFKFMAYFNNTRDEDVPGDYPLLRNYDDTLKAELMKVVQWVTAKGSPQLAQQFKLFLRTWQPSVNSTTADSLHNAVIGNNNYALMVRNHSIARLKKVDIQNASQLIWNFYSNKPNGILQIRKGAADGPVIVSIPIKPMNQWRRESVAFPQQEGIHDLFLTYQNSSMPAGSEDFAIVFDWLAFLPSLPGSDQPGYAGIKNAFWKLVTTNNVTTTPVMVENPLAMWRTTNVFERGNWRTLGEEVKPAVPASLAYAMPADVPANRLGLAQWFTNKKNPLVSRTLINRLWEQLFGTGIVETLEDMGTQGLPPTHKELLDYLSWQFMYNANWSIKAMIKKMVMSATYRQDSRLTDEMREKDLFNRYYARGPRLRLSAEQLRDQHLYISGLLSDKMYGPGVMPWQPEGIWLSPYNGARWQQSTDGDQYRRAVYTYWKRSSPYPSMISFDGVQRVVCNARRIRTNTPLQALVTLNDSAYLDMARHFAKKIMKEETSLEKQMDKAYERMLYKKIPVPKQQVFTGLYQQAYNEFVKDKQKMNEMLGSEDKENTAAMAAMVVVANALLNIDEVVMKN